MTCPEEIKKIRQKCFLTQEAFAKELKVSFSTVNRWEGGKTRPNLSAMKEIKNFCEVHNMEYTPLEDAWLNFSVEMKNV